MLSATLRRTVLRAWKPILGVYLFYLFGVHLLINTPILPWLIDQPNSVSLRWDWAFAPFPGWAYAHGYYMNVEDDNIQLGLRIDRVAFWYDPFAFRHLLFRIINANATGASFRIRLKRTPEEAAANPDLIAALPPIEGFPSVTPPPRPASTPFDGNPVGIWTVRIEDAHALAREFWIEGVHYQGHAEAYGSFEIQPMVHVNVDARLRLDSGEMDFGPRRVAQGLSGTGVFVLDRFSIFDESGLQPLRHMHGRIALDGDLENARFLNPVLSRTPAPTFASSPGRFELFAKFEAGHIAPGSTFRLRATDWQLAKGVYRSSGNYAQLEAAVEAAPVPTLSAVVALGAYEVDNPQIERELVEGSGLQLKLVSQRLDLLDKPLDDLGFEVAIDQARIPDLRIVNDFLPPSRLWEMIGGSGELTGSFVSPPIGAGHGEAHLMARDAALRVKGVRLEGGLKLDAVLGGVASNSRELGILGRDELEGQGQLTGHLAVSNLRDTARHSLATFDLDADSVLHPLHPTAIKGADVLHHLSGELKLTGVVPTLDFLNGALEERGVRVEGGAGTLSLDARLTHGILGRASELRFRSREVSVASEHLVAKADLAIDAHVGELSSTPNVELEARMQKLSAGTPQMPALLTLQSLRLLGQSPEIDVSALTAERPQAELFVESARLANLAGLDPLLPHGLHFAHGNALASLHVLVPPRGEGHGELKLQVDDLVANAGPITARGRMSGEATVAGLAESPWKADLLGRSRLAASLSAEGAAHLELSGTDRASSQLHFSAHGQAGQPTTLSLAAVRDALNGQIDVEGQVAGLSELNRFLEGVPLRLRGGLAAFEGHLVAERGQPVAGTRARAQIPDLAMLIGPLCLSGGAEITAALDAQHPGSLLLETALPSLMVRSRFLDQKYAESGQLKAKARLDPSDLSRTELETTIESVSLPHLEELAALVPSLKGLVLSAGRAEVGGTLHRDAAGKLTAYADLTAQHVSGTIARRPVSGDLLVTAKLTGDAQRTVLPEELNLSGSTLRVEKASIADDHDYWAEATLQSAALTLGPGRVTAHGAFEVHARDAVPFIHQFGPQLGIPGILDGFFAFSHLAGTGELQIDKLELSLPRFDVRGDGIRLQGRVRRSEEHHAADLLLDLGLLTVGMDIRDDHTGLQLIGAEHWYEQKLRSPLASGSE